MKELIIATKNQGKAKDFESIFGPLGYTVKTLNDVASHIDVEETSSTFEGNAILKAEALAKELHTFVIADDSGLEVDALDGEPGIYSARYAGEAKDDNANMDLLLQNLEGIEDEKRTARFVCAIAVAAPGKETETYRGTCEGRIAFERKGAYGFGYDPIFWVPELGKMMAELKPEEKAAISHRGQAIRKVHEAWNFEN
ncbi:XTP/dITP diphosphatase [Chryseomicrobium palamuruense]|uniref:dITP/XTP pyrophosphatase n=1 Tax=Chryseomicrobium palamuruense TaxID=682973 RepID=A0ABV8UZL1_9BACL